MIVSDRITAIFMFPAGGTRRYSIRRGWFICGLCLLIAFPLCGVVGAVYGYEMLKGRDVLMHERDTLQAKCDEALREVRRLRATVGTAGRKSMPQVHVKETPVPVKDVKAAEAYRQSVDKNVVRVEKTVFRQIRPGELRLIMEIYSLKQSEMLSGRVIFSLQTANGKVYPLTHEDTGFKIIRFRKVSIPATLPISNVNMQGASVIVEILALNTVVFRRSYPLQTS